MPELPEVETVLRGLAPAITRAKIITAEIRRPDLRRPFPENMAARLTGAVVQTLRRRSKYILADLSSNETLIIHLGMSGRILLEKAAQRLETAEFHNHSQPVGKHDHVVLTFDTGTRLIYNDARRFGLMDLAHTSAVEGHPLLKSLGPESLGNSFHADYLRTVLKARQTPIKTALLDQKIVAGLGNIYVSEALWHAGISPLRKAGSLSPQRLARLVPAIRMTLENAIESGGSTLRDYRRIDGELGGFQDRFAVYDREGEFCRTPGCKGKITRITQAGRSTYYCRRCQR